MMLWLSAIAAGVLAAVALAVRDIIRVRRRIASAQNWLNEAAFEPGGKCRFCGLDIGTLVTAKGGRLSWVDARSRSFICPARVFEDVSFGHEPEGVNG